MHAAIWEMGTSTPKRRSSQRRTADRSSGVPMLGG
jgi:hypothetical protein